MARPNLLFIINHDFGRRFGCYGDPIAYTPALDALAAVGTRFDAHFCQVPLCGPSRASLFTGCTPLTTGRFDNQPFFARWRERHRLGRSPTGPVTLPESFRAAGYRTAAFGFVYHDAVDAPSWSDGHEQVPEWSDADEACREVPSELLAGWRTRDARARVRDRWRRLQAAGRSEAARTDPAVARAARGPAVERAEVADSAYPDGVATERAARWLETAGEQPFFCAVGFVAGHTPFRAPAQDWDRYRREALILAANRQTPEGSPEWAEGDSEPAQFYTTHGYTRPWRADEGETRELLHGHLATLSYVDRQVGILLEALERGGNADNTLVVVTADHGFHDGEHGYWGKHNCWDASLGVPLLLAGPMVAAGSAVTALTAHLDLFPTLCELCDIEPPPGLEGWSFAHLLHRPAAPHRLFVPSWRRHMWHDRLQVYDLASSVRTERYRYTRYLDSAGEAIAEELFDYANDPHERVNRADETSCAALRAQLATLAGAT